MPAVAPYLIRAYHQWIEDSSLTAHILVDCQQEGVEVPSPYIQQGKIVLNISTEAAKDLIINNDMIQFKARFDGQSQTIRVPTLAVLTIYAAENGEGMFFEKQASDVDRASEQAQKPNLTLLD